MRRTQSIEVVGIGDFDIYPIKSEDGKFKTINQDGEELTANSGKKETTEMKAIRQQVRALNTERDKIAFLDRNGTSYSKGDIFYDVMGNKIQKLNRTEKVTAFKITEWTDSLDLAESTTSLIDCNDTTKKIFEDKIGIGKALKFNLKKSSIGFKFHKAFIYMSEGTMILTTGVGSKIEAQKEFLRQRAMSEQAEITQIVQRVELNADELAVAMEI